MSKHEPGFGERQQAAKKAKLAQLKRIKAKDPTQDPDFEKRQAERAAKAKERDARKAEQIAAKAEERKRKAEERVAAKITKEKEAEEALLAEAEAAERAVQDEIDLKARQKAARDEKYAKRKARKR